MYNIVCNVNNVVCITYNNIAFLQNLNKLSTTYFRAYCILQQQFLMSQLPVFLSLWCNVVSVHPPSDKSGENSKHITFGITVVLFWWSLHFVTLTKYTNSISLFLCYNLRHILNNGQNWLTISLQIIKILGILIWNILQHQNHLKPSNITMFPSSLPI